MIVGISAHRQGYRVSRRRDALRPHQYQCASSGESRAFFAERPMLPLAFQGIVKKNALEVYLEAYA